MRLPCAHARTSKRENLGVGDRKESSEEHYSRDLEKNRRPTSRGVHARAREATVISHFSLVRLTNAHSCPLRRIARIEKSRLKKIDGAVLQVKTERLTPDNNSTSSRSVTPSSSSHPGTPPNATPLGGPEGPQPPHHLKHMEQMMGRNYSDFMRSLAAKYNNANPNEYVPRVSFQPLRVSLRRVAREGGGKRREEGKRI